MASLVPCTSCERHIWDAEPLCPFCRQGRPSSAKRDEPRRDGVPLMGRAGVLALGAAGMAALGCSDAQPIPMYGAAIGPPIVAGQPANVFVPSTAGAANTGGMPSNVAGAPSVAGGAGAAAGGAGPVEVDASVSVPDMQGVDAGASDGDAGTEPEPIAAVDLMLSGASCPWPDTALTLPEGQSLSDFRSSAAPERVVAESCAVVGDPTRGYVVSGHIDVGTSELTVTTRTAVMAGGGAIDVVLERPGTLPSEGLRSLQPCSARVLQVLESGGAVFLQFSCSQLASPLEPGEACTVVDAGLILENCAK